MNMRAEQLPPNVRQLQLANADLRTSVAENVAAMGDVLVRPGDNAVESKLRDNHFLLLAGQHEGFVCEMPGTSITGQPGAQLTRLITPRGTPQYFNGIHFTSVAGSNNNTMLVDLVNATGTYRFVNCRFTKRAIDPAGCVRMAVGTQAQFVNCTFDGTGPAGLVLINVLSANPADCILIGCTNLTASAYGVITSIGNL
jgi:hypothetical protein